MKGSALHCQELAVVRRQLTSRVTAQDVGGRSYNQKQHWKGARIRMSEETIEGLKKPLDKMTVKELREVALELPEITGVHGMNKTDLLAAVKKAKGIEDTFVKKTSATVSEVKKQIKSFKEKRASALKKKNAKMASIYRRRISRLKKKSRRVA
jgi:hypothetical protein